MIGFIKLSRFHEVWSVHNPETPDAFGWQGGKFVLYGSDWKWYESYDDVKAWDELWEQMKEVKGVSGYFCRVGEDPSDIEQYDFGDDPCYDYFYPVSGLQFDGEDFLGKRETDVKEEPTEQACADSQEVQT